MIRRTFVMVVVLCALASAVDSAQAQFARVKGIDSLQFRVNLQVQYNTTSIEDEIGSEWLLRRARLMARMWLAGWVQGDLEGDFGRGRAALTDGFVKFTFAPPLIIRIGQYKKPFDALQLISSRYLIVAERDGSPRGTDGPTPSGLVEFLGYSNRDIGVEYSGGHGDLDWVAGFWNGAGANEADDDEGEQPGARLTYEIAPSWRVSGGWTAKQISDPPDAEEATWYHAGELALTGGEYQEPGWQAFGQLMVGDNWDPEQGGGDDSTFLAVQGIVGYFMPIYRVPYLIGFEPILRIGWTDPDTDVDDDAGTLVTPGLNFYLHEHLRSQFQLDYLSIEDGDGEFAFRIHTVLEF